MARSQADLQADDTIDHTADETVAADPAPVAPDDAARAQELRVAALTEPLGEADKAELDKLAKAEADAAGHPEPVEQTGSPDPLAQLMHEILSGLEHIADVVPSVRGLVPRLAAMRQRLDAMISPPPKS